MDDYTTAVELGIARRRSGHEQAEAAIDSVQAPADELEALAFWEQLAELASARVPGALATAAEAHEWSTIGAVLATSATSAAQRHRRYQARRNAS
jgi:hypothetical protein